jgi:4-aminobutyrate aminotransferase
VTAKALGNGIPISTFSTTDEISMAYSRPSASTFGGNPVAAQTALSVLKYIEKDNLVNRAKELGEYLKQKLLLLKSPFIKEIRGCGLMLGMQIQAQDQNNTSAEITDMILEEMKERGFMVGKNGMNRDVIAFQPPLVITKEDIDAMVENLKQTLDKLSSSIMR